MTAPSWRERRAARDAADRAVEWRFRRAVARVEVVDRLVADYATTFCGRPYRRREVLPSQSAVELPGVTWTVEDEVFVEFLPADRGPGLVLVHEVALLGPLRKHLRSRHLRVEHYRSMVRSRR